MGYFKIYLSRPSVGYELVLQTKKTSKVDEFVTDVSELKQNYNVLIIYRSKFADHPICHFSDVSLSSKDDILSLHQRVKKLYEAIPEAEDRWSHSFDTSDNKIDKKR